MKSKLRFAVVSILTAFLFSACSAPATEPKAEVKTMDMEKTKAQIQGMENAFAAAEKAKDVDGIAAYYSDDAISYSRNTEPASGKEAIKKQIAANLAKDSTKNVDVYKVVDLFGDENLLVEVGSWSVMNPAGTEVDKGHYMSCFKKQADGSYKCFRDMNVTSTPVKKPM